MGIDTADDMEPYRGLLEDCFQGKKYVLSAIGGGLSEDIKVKASCEGREYIVKVIEGHAEHHTYKPDRAVWYQVLGRIRRGNPGVLGPVWYGAAREHVVTVTEWIKGEQLNEYFVSNPETMVRYGKAVGTLLYELHHQEFVRQMITAKKVKAADKNCRVMDALLQEIHEHDIVFSGMDQAAAYLEANQGVISEERAGIVHNDIRPENFLLADGQIYIYDFDSGTINDCFADFTYLSAMSQAYYRPFSYAVIMSYFQEAVPMEFWRANLWFCIIKLFDYAVYKYRKKGKMIVNQAENFRETFDDYKNAVPGWWQDMHRKYYDAYRKE